jgi:hypothetical protein
LLPVNPAIQTQHNTALLVTQLLLLAISLDGFCMLRKILPKVVGMSLPPLSLAIAGDLAILRSRAQLLSVIIAAALALRLAADNLLRTINRRQERTLAIRTTAGSGQADSSLS